MRLSLCGSGYSGGTGPQILTVAMVEHAVGPTLPETRTSKPASWLSQNIVSFPAFSVLTVHREIVVRCSHITPHRSPAREAGSP